MLWLRILSAIFLIASPILAASPAFAPAEEVEELAPVAPQAAERRLARRFGHAPRRCSPPRPARAREPRHSHRGVRARRPRRIGALRCQAYSDEDDDPG